MSLGLNTLKGGTTQGIKVDSFIKNIKNTIKADAEKNKNNNPIIQKTNIGLKTSLLGNVKKDLNPKAQVMSSIANLMHVPSIGDKIDSIMDCPSESFKDRLNDGVGSLKNDALSAISGIKSLAHKEAEGAVNAYNDIKNTAESGYQKVAGLANINSDIKNVGNFIEGMGKSLIATGTALLHNEINKLSTKYSNCNKVPKNLTGSCGGNSNAVVNALTQAALSQQVKNMDCSGGSGMSALSNMANGSCSSGGVGVAGAAKVMKSSSSAVNVTASALAKVAGNDKFKGLVNKTFNPEKTIRKVLNNDNGTSNHSAGRNIVNVFGSSSITHLKKEATSRKHSSRTNRKRKENAYIEGITRAVKIAL